MPTSEKVRVVRCINCRNGKVFSTHVSDFRDCPECRGSGVVVKDKMCACGGPVFSKSDEGVFYCGRKECLKNLLEDAEEEEDQSQAFNGFY